MKQKLSLVFLTLSISNLYATSETGEVALLEATPLLSRVTSPNMQVTTPIIFPEIGLSRVQLQRISQTVTTLQYPLLPHQTSTGFILRGQGLVPLKSGHFTLRYLESLNKTNWEKWIKAYGVPTSSDYFIAINSAAEYAKEHESEWEDFRRKIVDEPSSVYKFFHSRTMRNRAAFFQMANCCKIEQRQTANLQQQLCTQSETISTLMAKIDSQAAIAEEVSRSKSALESRLAALEQKLSDETRQRQTLEDEMKELREQKTVEQTSSVGSPKSVPTKADMTEVSEAFTSQIEELRAQFEELTSSIASSADAELAEKVQALSDKVDAMDLDGIRADVETLKATKVGVKSMTKFAYLVNSLVDAQILESEKGMHISTEDWNQIVKKNKNTPNENTP